MKIILEHTDNGIIKHIIDDNIDGGGKMLERKEIFILDDDIMNTEKFLKTLIKDLGLYTGNPDDKEVLRLEKTYGPEYYLSTNEAQEKRKILTSELNRIKRLTTQK